MTHTTPDPADHPADLAFMAGIDADPDADPAITASRLARLFARPLEQVQRHEQDYRALLLGDITADEFVSRTGDAPDPEIHYEAAEPALSRVLTQCIDGHHDRCPLAVSWMTRPCRCDCHRPDEAAKR